MGTQQRISCHACGQPTLRIRRRSRRAALTGYGLLLIALAGLSFAVSAWFGHGLLAAEEGAQTTRQVVLPIAVAVASVGLFEFGWRLRATRQRLECPRCEAVVQERCAAAAILAPCPVATCCSSRSA